ncbi:hypothetical protein AVO44_08430 [Ruegeria profundi]|uniref:Uncharacterized protein n=1 Tax=Ruegeria profundi TaxID=1685378 RepID=A0A0X3TU41_9RHOB|nr:hypothetical protein AVO44_08430 [Ruegeria profundi]
MDGGEFLQTSHTPETLHSAFSSSERQVRILNAVVEQPARHLFVECAQFSENCHVRSEAVREDFFCAYMALLQFLEEFQCCSFISTFGENRFQHLTFVIYGTPEIVPLSIHLHENLIHLPLLFRECAQPLDALSSDL